MSLQLKQEKGISQASILEAFDKLSDQPKFLQEHINKPSASVLKPPSHSEGQADPTSRPGTSRYHVLDPNLRPTEPRDPAAHDFTWPPLPPQFQNLGLVLDPPPGLSLNLNQITATIKEGQNFIKT